MQTKPLLVIGLAVILAAVGYFLFNGDANPLPEDIAFGNGRLEAVQVDISTKIAGRVKEVLVNEGDLVQAGQTVAKIDVAQLQAQLLRAEAEIASAESQAAAAQAAIAQANAQLVFAEQELQRADRLLRKGHVSRETYDTRISNRTIARANLTAAEATLVSRQRGIDAARAVAEEIKTQIDDSTLKSTIMGRVLYRLTEQGEVLGNGGKVLTLLNLGDVYMEIFLPAAQAHRVAIGGDALIKLDILDFAVPGKVSFVSPQSQFTPKQVETPSEREKLMFRVKVRVPQDLVLGNIDQVKTGVRGVAYVRLASNEQSEWPEFLKEMPPGIARETN